MGRDCKIKVIVWTVPPQNTQTQNTQAGNTQSQNTQSPKIPKAHSAEKFVRWITIFSQCRKIWGAIQFCFNVENCVKWITILSHRAENFVGYPQCIPNCLNFAAAFCSTLLSVNILTCGILFRQHQHFTTSIKLNSYRRPETFRSRRC